LHLPTSINNPLKKNFWGPLLATAMLEAGCAADNAPLGTSVVIKP
jgi:hypothetical protein